jgi:hypothetical protein
MDISRLAGGATAVNDAVITLTDSGILTGVTVPFQDRTAEIIESVLKIGIGIIKFAAVAGTVVFERDVLEEVTVTRLIQLCDMTKTPLQDGRFQYEYIDTNPLIDKFPSAEAPPNLTIRITSPNDLHVKSEPPPPPQMTSPRGMAAGVYVRIPTPVIVDVVTFGKLRGSAASAVAQGGGFNFIPIQSRAFANTSTALKISAVTGGVTQFNFSSTASGEAAAKAAQSATAQFLALRGELLDAQKDLLVKEKALLEAQKALEAARTPP